MAKAKQQVSLLEQVQILESTQFISLFASLISAEFQVTLVDKRFLDPNMNNHAKRIRESAILINEKLSMVAGLKNEEEFKYEYVTELHALFTHFLSLPIAVIARLNEAIKESKMTGADVPVNV
jgi:hypothetical protein